MNRPAIESLPIAIPPLNEQCFTTLVLDSIDVQIRKERSALKKIRELKVARMDYRWSTMKRFILDLREGLDGE